MAAKPHAGEVSGGTSTEICFRFLDDPQPGAWTVDVNNHAGVDGILSVYVLLHSPYHRGGEIANNLTGAAGMKTTVVALLITLGTILILAPLVAGQVHEANVARLLEQGHTSVSLETLSAEYALGCWIAGVGMIGVGVVLAVWFARQEPPRP